MNFNRVILIGNIAADPEVRTTPSGQQVASLRIATNRTWTDKQGAKQSQAEFHNVVAWGRLAEIISQYVQKGSLMMIEGRLQTRSWEGKDGVKRYRTEVIAENIQLGPKGAGTPSPAKQEAKDTKQEEEIPVIEEDDDIDVKDIPF
ncbi:MAG: single-stranded DNA-binding protein [bacterium]|nr:single-stranded DNA-binding protein [bacterium]MDZ4231725.1 single-stranded DNA-binding protein [Candidatus Pacearchaeota archaeon]